jgi:hypothetical protein
LQVLQPHARRGARDAPGAQAIVHQVGQPGDRPDILDNGGDATGVSDMTRPEWNLGFSLTPPPCAGNSSIPATTWCPACADRAHCGVGLMSSTPPGVACLLSGPR